VGAGGSGVDALFAEVRRAGENAGRLRELMAREDPDDARLLELLRRAVPVRLLELLAATPPWSERPRVLGAVVLNPRAPRPLAQRLLPSLYWRDLADVAASPRLGGGVRAGAETILRERIPDLRLGERIALAKVATPAVLRLLLADADPKVVRPALANPRLREEDLLQVVRDKTCPRTLLEEAPSSSRWREQYAVRLAVVLQPRTPLGIALGQLSSLLPRDLVRVAEAEELAPLVQAAARRLAEGPPDAAQN
jgi:hypothetical protein